MNDFDRYSRQIMVDKIGLRGQQKLSQSRVVIVGAGGLGCTVGVQLAGAGIGEIHIVDHDDIALSNLHRQILFRESDLGASKALTASNELKRVNSDCSIVAHNVRLNTKNIDNLCDDIDAVIDAADNFTVSYLLSDQCSKTNTPLIAASVNQTFGHVGQFCGSGPSLRAVFPRLPKDLQSCDMVGVTGPSVGVIASIQAQETLKLLIGDESQLKGKLLYLDLWNYSQQVIDFANAQESQNRHVRLIGAEDITASDVIIDVRSDQEVAEAPQPFDNVRHIPLSELANQTAQLPKQTALVCACLSGQRALIAGQLLLDLGYNDISALVP